jgi:hypothetical protein
MRERVFTSKQWVPTPIDVAFPFFADAGNLEAITPPFLHFSILTPRPIPMREGARIEYRLRLHGVPVRWVTRIDLWQPGRAFVDRQLSGPYAKWVHLHTFEACDGGTLLRDEVHYAVPLDPLSRPVRALFVTPTVERIFAYRREAIARVLGEDARIAAG